MYKRFISGGRDCRIWTEYFHYSGWACKVPFAVTRNVVPIAPISTREPDFGTIPIAVWLTRVPTCIFHTLATYPLPTTPLRGEANPNWCIWWKITHNGVIEGANIASMNISQIPATAFTIVFRFPPTRFPITYPIAWIVEVWLGVLTPLVSDNIPFGTISDVFFSRSLLRCLTGYPFIFFSLSLFFSSLLLKTSLFFFLLNSFFFGYPSFLCLASQSFLFLSDSF